MRDSQALLLALVVTVAGCGAAPQPSATPAETASPFTAGAPSPATTPRPPTHGSPTPTVTPAGERCTTPRRPVEDPPDVATHRPDSDPDIVVSGDALAVDPERLFRRVSAITGTDARPPDEIHVHSLTRVDTPRSRFERLLGLQPGSFGPSGLATPTGDVYLNASLNRTTRELVLAHEFYHIIFFQQNYTLYGGATDHTSQEATLITAIAEGAADYVQQAYWRRHMETGSSPAAETRHAYRAASASNRTLLAPYVFGYRYLEARIDSPRNLERVYEHPPRTTEQLIHRLPPGSEPPAGLNVTVIGNCQWAVNGTDTRGELFVRHVLQTELNESTAIAAAAGWGNDTVRRLTNGSTTGFVWTLRFDDTTNASAFGAAVREYLDARGTRDGDVWTTSAARFRVVEPTEDTVLLVFGPPRFVRGVTVDGDAGRVVVRAP